MLIIIIAGVSCWPAFVALGAEVSSLSLRSQSQGIGWSFGSMMTCIFSVALPYIYNLDAGDLRGKIAFVYAGLCALCLVVSFFFVPEVSHFTLLRHALQRTLLLTPQSDQGSQQRAN